MINLERRIAEMEKLHLADSSFHQLVVCGTPEEAAQHRQTFMGAYRYIITGVQRCREYGREPQAVEN